MTRNPLIVVLGATGTGKTKLAVELCKKFSGELLNTDSMQLYKGLDISTNKATDEEMQGIPQHMIGFLEPTVTGFNVIQFRDLILSKIRELWKEKKLPVIVGGTSYYIEAVLWHQLIKEEGTADMKTQPFKDWYTEAVPPELISMSNEDLHGHLRSVDAALASRLHPNNRRRVFSALQTYYRERQSLTDYWKLQQQQDGNVLGGSLRFHDVCMFYLNTSDWEALVRRLDGRVDDMIERGLERELTHFYDTYHRAHREQIDQVRLISPDIDDELIESEYTKGPFQSIGLKEFRDFLALSPDERRTAEGRRQFGRGCDLLKVATRKYARRQQRFVRNRLLKHPDRNLPSMYELDVTDASQWSECVSAPAETLARCFLDGVSVPDEYRRFECQVADRANSDEHRRRFAGKSIRCDYCQTIVSCENDWLAHINGKKHKYVRSKYLRSRDMSTDIGLDNNGRREMGLDDDNQKEDAVPVQHAKTHNDDSTLINKGNFKSESTVS